MDAETQAIVTVGNGGKDVPRLVPPNDQSRGISGTFPEFAGFWDDPNETAIDPEVVPALAGDCA